MVAPERQPSRSRPLAAGCEKLGMMARTPREPSGAWSRRPSSLCRHLRIWLTGATRAAACADSANVSRTMRRALAMPRGRMSPILSPPWVRYLADMMHLALLGVALLLVACDDSKGLSVGALAGDEWRLVRWISDGKPVALADGVQITLAVTPDGDVSGSGSVNRYRGKMTLTDTGKVSWGGAGFATTRMAGPQPLMDQEARYLAALAEVHTAAVDGRTLTLAGTGQTVVLQYDVLQYER
jgi:heat shock protein HslJ